MKCLLKYQWVKLPRSQMPAGKGVMGAWARLASRAAFRNGQARYYKYVNQVKVQSGCEKFEDAYLRLSGEEDVA